jgi:hypothetical protein
MTTWKEDVLVAGALVAVAVVSLGSLALFIWSQGIQAGPTSMPARGAKLGVTSSATNQIVITVNMCPGEMVTSVSLGLSDSQYSSVRSILWEIRPGLGSPTPEFIVGDSPPGFTNTTPLVAKISPSDYLHAVLDTSWQGRTYTFGISFRGADAQPSAIYVRGPGLLGETVHVTQDRFESVTDKVCELQPLPVAA